MDDYLKVTIKSEDQLDKLLKERGYGKFISFKYDRSDLEKRFPFFKKFWYYNIPYYSYSIDKINSYFGRTILEKGTVMSAFVINYLIHLYHKEKYWGEITK